MKKSSRRKYANFFLFYILMFIIIFVSYSFARYSIVATSNSTITIAKFNVKVNDTSIKKNEKFDLKLSSKVQKTTDNKLAPGNNGYFEITIDPTGTEVSLEYQFNLTFSNTGIGVKGYSINDGNMVNNSNSTITGTINLPTTSKAFEAKDKVSIKIYCDWKNSADINASTVEQASVNVSAIIAQKV